MGVIAKLFEFTIRRLRRLAPAQVDTGLASFIHRVNGWVARAVGCVPLALPVESRHHPPGTPVVAVQ